MKSNSSSENRSRQRPSFPVEFVKFQIHLKCVVINEEDKMETLPVEWEQAQCTYYCKALAVNLAICLFKVV